MPITKDTFELAFRRCQDLRGHSYDPWDIEMAWRGYQTKPSDYQWVIDFISNGCGVIG